MPSIYDIASQLTPLGMDKALSFQHVRGAGKALPRVTDGLKAAKLPTVEGLHTLTPAQLLGLHIPVVSVNGQIEGYQRPNEVAHARNIARAMLEGRLMPPIIVALEGSGPPKVTDGQHRALGAVLAGLPIQAVFIHMDADRQRDLFAGQRRARPVNANTLILAGSGPYERYIQEAAATNGNPWSHIVSASRASRTRITPHQMLQLLIRFVGNTEGNTASIAAVERWDRATADQMAPLVACFGNRQTNPLAFQPTALRAIGSASMHVFRRNEAQASDAGRWITHMPKFAFERYTFIRTASRMTDELLAHWNKRLSAERRVTR